MLPSPSSTSWARSTRSSWSAVWAAAAANCLGSSPRWGAWPRSLGGCAASARVPWSWPRPACWTAGPRRPTGHPATPGHRYPDVEVLEDPIFVRDDNVWTSAGVTAGIDLACACVEEDFGPAVAFSLPAGWSCTSSARWSEPVQRSTRRPGHWTPRAARLQALGSPNTSARSSLGARPRPPRRERTLTRAFRQHDAGQAASSRSASKPPARCWRAPRFRDRRHRRIAAAFGTPEKPCIGPSSVSA